ncbi:hypothetical protein [Bradyrhizobium sp. Ai1a-2]|uniref:hypothetical protein n=1 Tax=Bradyrhizobium sp. Ai1a-2 TaxID=196490 RepID=UPI000488CDF9|nr:hypothetical protein [Bradyrhizobium sp. Ai1a-2]
MNVGPDIIPLWAEFLLKRERRRLGRMRQQACPQARGNDTADYAPQHAAAIDFIHSLLLFAFAKFVFVKVLPLSTVERA